jgi:FkbM family methyltransferase
MRTPLLHHSIVARAVKVLRALRMMGLYRNWRLAFRNRFGTEIPNERVVYRLRSGGLFAMQAGPHDVRVLNEVWLDRIYEPTTDFRVLDGWTVVDLGAHKGSFTVRAALSGRRTKVHAVEPIPTNLECLYRNIALNEINNVSVVEGVVSSSDGDFFLDVNRFSSGASSLLIDRDLKDRIRVRGVSLDELLRPLSTRIDLVKMDIEGAELDVLRCTSSDTLARIRRIVLEYHATPSESEDDVGKQLKTLLVARDFRCGEVPERRLLFAVRL